MKVLTYLAALVLLLAATVACTKKPAGAISVTDAWVRATHPGQQTGAAYLSINSATAASLIKVESPAAAHAEIHSMEMQDGIMLMREMDALVLPANQNVSLAPGGNHIMLMNLKQPMIAGEKVPLKLSIKRGDETIQMDVQADVRKN